MKKLRTGIGVLAAALSLTACEGSTQPVPELAELPRPLTSTEGAVIESSNRFAFNLFRQSVADGEGDNVSISPFSISMALGMTLNGAAGDTWLEMRNVLDFEGMQQEQINGAYSGLLDLLHDIDSGTTFNVANSVWYRAGFPFEQSFLTVVRSTFDARIEALDFGQPSAPKTINDWVRAETGGRIPSIVEEIDRDKVMYLINALYFDGNWRTRFDPALTRSAPFFTENGENSQVQMMSIKGRFAHAWTRDFQAVELPYGNGAFVMTLLLPSEELGVADWPEKLNPEVWSELVRGLSPREVTVELPQFRIESDMNLNETLKTLGMPTAFMEGRADFTGMSPSGRELYISEVRHRTFIDVDEEGTEAAAATSVGISVTSAPPSLRFDRPFVAILRERLSETILFMTAVAQPMSRLE